MCALGTTAWPKVNVGTEAFARFVAPRVPPVADPVAHLADLSAAGLFLSCGCALGMSPAAAAFVEHVRPVVHQAAKRDPSRAAEDLEQDVYRRLFLVDSQRDAKIFGYTGQGDLRTWVGVVATRIAINAARKKTPGHSNTIIERWAETVTSHEFNYLATECEREFKAAFASAVGQLSARDRNVLRYHLGNLTADQIGRIHRVHRVTVARWLSRIRTQLLEVTRTALQAQLRASHRDVESVMRLVDGEVCLSLNRLLASTASSVARESL